MKILVVCGYCLKVNSSATLCHIAYINGLIKSGHTVDLITVSDKNKKIDKSIQFPKVRNLYEYDVSLYERLGGKKNAGDKMPSPSASVSKQASGKKKKSLKKRIKILIRRSYGVYGTDTIWYKHAGKFKTTEKYDCIISLAHPPISHKVVAYLLKKKRVSTDKWIQIWEDPWYNDLFGFNYTDKVRQAEDALLKSAESIYYVSPITLSYQKKEFSESAEKMRWQPLPSYYSAELKDIKFNKLVFGYFGDYYSYVRNLKPFYNAALQAGLEANICGSANRPFASAEKVNVYPRMPLDKLKEFEDKTNVLVFLCNLRGGQIPGKIYQYSATNKLILFILDGTDEEKTIIKDYFSKYNRYIFCDNNEASIIEAVNKIKNNSLPENYHTPLTDFQEEKIINNILKGV